MPNRRKLRIRQRLKAKPNEPNSSPSYSTDEVAAKIAFDVEHEELLERGGKLEDPFSEGDQSPVSGDDVLVSQKHWVTATNTSEYNPLGAPYMSEWSRSCFTGDVKSIKKWVEDDPTIIEYRESIMRRTGILHVISGSFFSSVPDYFSSQMKSKMDFKAALEYLIDKGANIQCRDFAGQSPLHYCCSRNTDTTFELAKVLLKRGADPNAVDRNGCTPAFWASTLRDQRLIEMLLYNGAKLNVKNNDGICLKSTVLANPKLRQLVVKAMTKEGKEQRAAARARGTYRKCAVCGKDEKCQRCSGCYIQWYCSTECQKEQWKDHKEGCNRTRKEYKMVTLDKTMINHKKKDNVPKKMDTTTKQHFLVKIELSLEDQLLPERPKSNGPIGSGLLMSDRNRLIHGVIPKTDEHYGDIVEKVKTEGVAGSHGYFYAIKENGEISVNISQIQPPEDF